MWFLQIAVSAIAETTLTVHKVVFIVVNWATLHKDMAKESRII